MSRRDLIGDTRPLPDITWADVFQRCARRTPDLTALVADGRSWTFQELDTWANRLAHLLRAPGPGATGSGPASASGAGPGFGVAPGTAVACAMTRSVLAVIVPLAVSKAGCVYVPVAVDAPATRLGAILEDARPGLLLTDAPELTISLPPGTRRVDLPRDRWQADLCVHDPAPPAPSPASSAAYVIYTSGSTGRPKGVVVADHSLVNLYYELEARYFGRGDRHRVAYGLPLVFDASWNPLLWMAGGHELHLVPDDVRKDPEGYVRFIRERRLTVVEAVPTLVEAMVKAGLLVPGTRPELLLMGGEAISGTLWSRLSRVDGMTAVNLYGPTECTVFATACRLDEHDSPVIGRPIANIRARLVGEDGESVPEGEPGELQISGACVATGYLNQAGLTAERFPEEGRERWYRTGDLCRLLPGGLLEFLGRLDDQVKIRGHRVEPGEVERFLLAQPGVRQAAVVPEGPEGALRLAAYVVLTDTDARGTMAETLRAELPDYLVPATITVLDALPLNANGKVDRSVLRRVETTSSVPPRTPVEELIAAVWCEVLPVERADIRDNFFDAGGDSLLAAELAARLRAAGIHCTIRDVLRFPTIPQLATLAHITSGIRPNVPEEAS
ncbi:amino acid adenylation domain-containing protein [Streptosporangium sp. NPDC005286]|uniref:amino acid adenylation domain-containing protein n=1 Tax=Streptosporangium sp. NPDC005286 TaxID=3154463 RepID=UPI0033B979E6